jgi:hypothetical protein
VVITPWHAGMRHVQLAITPGSEDHCREFSVGVLGHLGAEADFRPARKAHPGIRTDDLDALARRARGPRRRLEFLSPA